MSLVAVYTFVKLLVALGNNNISFGTFAFANNMHAGYAISIARVSNQKINLSSHLVHSFSLDVNPSCYIWYWLSAYLPQQVVNAIFILFYTVTYCDGIRFGLCRDPEHVAS